MTTMMETPITLPKAQVPMDGDALAEKNKYLEKELEYIKSELQSTRKILNERDELLLHLQWDEDDAHIDYEGQKKKSQKKSKDKVMTEERQKINRLRSQMKLMENALDERDLNIQRLEREMSEKAFMFQQQIEALKAPREAPQRSKTSWGFRSSPTSSPLNYKKANTSSPSMMSMMESPSTRSGASATSSPTNSPMSPMPNYSISSPTTASPAMDSYDFKKMKKKQSLFTFKKSAKKQHTPIQEVAGNWATQSQ
ncbi:hypothetical protein PPL_02040 [Heterostelium album PN500]|uniref:Uncharacterized protein n=1 Tax=Heterostelium pallidum (strain ATCC 26659 / Pp 5 / PN500) TaxID=670386 RepID=D3B170_HETP5|nr:hypothetical protein PPL_02040 [Heterostelium album PN500]EFA85044.1 hypothetical protein PPL_02040 [Heterostelium album PN500]|eukprot:XP_020437154.1 hypothetical protein PPL_02040 [Heterostelium album PN500]